MRSRPTIAFTLIEMLVAVTIIAVVALAIMPGLTSDERIRVMAASAVMISDIEFAQAMTIADPSNPVVVRFDDEAPTYWLAFADDPDTPMMRPDTDEVYLVTMGEGRAIASTGVTFEVEGVTDGTIAFDTLGALLDFGAEPIITFMCGERWIEIAVAPSTGSVIETSDLGEVEEVPIEEPTEKPLEEIEKLLE